MKQLLLGLALPFVLLSGPQPIAFGDPTAWLFVNGIWTQETDVIKPPAARADCFYAFRGGAAVSHGVRLRRATFASALRSDHSRPP